MSIVINIVVARQFTEKVIFGLDSKLAFKVSSIFVYQAYIQSTETLQRDVYFELLK